MILNFQADLTAMGSFIPELDEANIYMWDGNYYALEITTRLELEDSSVFYLIIGVRASQWNFERAQLWVQ